MATTSRPADTPPLDSAPPGGVPLASDWTDWPANHYPNGGRLAAKISTQMVGLLRRHAGRGPTRAKTAISADLVVVCLEDCLTPAEKQVAAAGHTELIDRTRHVIHQAMRAEATSIIEELTHRQVAAYLADQDHNPDIAIIAFHLTPTPPETG